MPRTSTGSKGLWSQAYAAARPRDVETLQRELLMHGPVARLHAEITQCLLASRLSSSHRLCLWFCLLYEALRVWGSSTKVEVAFFAAWRSQRRI